MGKLIRMCVRMLLLSYDTLIFFIIFRTQGLSRVFFYPTLDTHARQSCLLFPYYHFNFEIGFRNKLSIIFVAMFAFSQDNDRLQTPVRVTTDNRYDKLRFVSGYFFVMCVTLLCYHCLATIRKHQYFPFSHLCFVISVYL